MSRREWPKRARHVEWPIAREGEAPAEPGCQDRLGRSLALPTCEACHHRRLPSHPEVPAFEELPAVIILIVRDEQNRRAAEDDRAQRNHRTSPRLIKWPGV